MTKQIFEQNSVPEIIFYLKIDIVTSFKIFLKIIDILIFAYLWAVHLIKTLPVIEDR